MYKQKDKNNSHNFVPLSKLSTPGNFFLGSYEKKFRKIGYSDDQLKLLSKEVIDINDLRQRYFTAKDLFDNQQQDNGNIQTNEILNQPTQFPENNKNMNNIIINKQCCDCSKTQFVQKGNSQSFERNTFQNQINENIQQNISAYSDNCENTFPIKLNLNFDIFNNNQISSEEKANIFQKHIQEQLISFFQDTQKIQSLLQCWNKKENSMSYQNNNLLINLLQNLKNQNSNLSTLRQENDKNRSAQYDNSLIQKKKWGLLRQTKNSIQFQGSIEQQEIWNEIIKRQENINKDTMYTAILMDPPWQRTALKLNYKTMANEEWMKHIPLDKLQKVGYVFIWITNAMLESALEYLKINNYKRVDTICWLKIKKDWTNIDDLIGYYMRHNFELCLVAQKQQNLDLLKTLQKTHTVLAGIVAPRREQSRKPDEIYDKIETFIPNGYYLEIFGRRYNQRDGWVTFGNESIALKRPINQPKKKSKKAQQ